jgi:hypothetical protein
MNVRVTDRKVYESLSPTDLTAYLRASGWQLIGIFRESATVWKSHDLTVLLPEDTSAADYARRMAEVLEVLSKFEKRSQLEVLKDVATATADVVRLRVSCPGVNDGSIGIEEGLTVVASARELILSAARSAVTPKAYFRSRLPSIADDYMRRVRLGQTEHGSYVVTVVCPGSPELTVRGISKEGVIDEPFERKVTRTLAVGLHRATTAAIQARRTQDLQPFTESVPDGVSANLCKALADISEIVEEGYVELDFAWSRSRSRPEVPTSRVLVPHDSMPIMREAARVLRETFTDTDFELTGSVVRLDSPKAASGGDVFVLAQVEESWRRVKVTLRPEDYIKAVTAHEKGLVITCRGELQREGRYLVLKEARAFTVDSEG